MFDSISQNTHSALLNMSYIWSHKLCIVLIFISVLTLSSCMPQILHHHIAAVEKLPLTTSGCPLVIQCKNFRIVHFVVPRERDCHDIYNSLLQLSRTGSISNGERICTICLDYRGRGGWNSWLGFFQMCIM